MKKEEFKKKVKENFKYDENFVDEISSYVDNESDIQVFYNKIEFLDKQGVGQDGLDTILSENPLFLTSTLDTVKNSVNFLKNIKVENLSQILEINSELLSTSDKVMSENFKLLKVLMLEKDVLNVLKIDSEILSFNTDYLEKRLEFLVKNGLKDYVKEIILNRFEVFEDEEEEISVEELKEIFHIC